MLNCINETIVNEGILESTVDGIIIRLKDNYQEMRSVGMEICKVFTQSGDSPQQAIKRMFCLCAVFK